MNESDRMFACPLCMADPGQDCFIGDGSPSETIHLARRVTRLCSEKKLNAQLTKELVEKALGVEE